MPAAPTALAALVVDDDAFTRQTIARILEQYGAATTLQAANGAEALAVLAVNETIGLIICDLAMPEVDGIETLRRLADLNRAARIVVASAADPRVIRSAREMAASFGLRMLATLQKPLTLEKLQAALAEAEAAPPPRSAREAIAITAEEIRQGLAAGEFVAFFQPKVAIGTRRVAGAEALVRWQHPIYGLLSPDSFLPLAQTAGQLDLMTEMMLATATRQCAAWQRQGIAIDVSVNLPVSGLEDRGLPDRLQKMVAAHGVPPARLVLEITEDGWLKQAVMAREVLTRLRLRGFGLSIDDYGTGYSTAQQLLDAPFNELKIDQSFVRRALADEESMVVLASSIQLAHRLKLRSVAEGVESDAEWKLLAELGCDFAQGYRIARPMAREAFGRWYEGWQAS